MSKWRQDTVIIPPVSAHFGFYKEGQNKQTQDLKSLPLYKEDWLGLKTLDQQGKLHFKEMEGDHMDHQEEWFTENIIKNFLV